MKQHILVNRLEKVERLVRYAMQDKNTLKVRQGFHLISQLKNQLADISNPTLCHL
jgi:hypothetical protein